MRDELKRTIANTAARNIINQEPDQVCDYELPADLTVPYLDQGAVDFGIVAEACLAVLCAAIPGLGDVLAGTACIVPNVPTEEMLDAVDEPISLSNAQVISAADVEALYTAMLSATPYKEGTK